MWAISGMLVLVDYVSGTPAGTFFAVIGLSLGINDRAVSSIRRIWTSLAHGYCSR